MAKGVITNEIQFRGYNTVRMAPGAVFRCDAYNVQGLEYISQSFWVYAVSPLTSAVRARTRFFGEDGLTASMVDHAFIGPAGTFEWMTFAAIPVPVGAKYAALEFLSPAGTYYLTMPKTDQGENCTEYTANFSGQMTYITPTGVYTGIVTAGQVVLAGGNNLGTEMVTINNRLLTLTNTQNSHGGVISTHTTQLSALGMRVTWAEDDLTQVETDISAGNITLSSLTNGTLAGLGISSDRLEFTSAGSYMRIMSRVGYDFLRAGTSSSNILFRVSETGALTATSATITGTLTAGSIFAGNLSSAGGSVSNLGGTLSGMGGLVSGLGGTFGNISGLRWTGPITSTSGYLGAVAFTSFTGGVRLQGSVQPNVLQTQQAGASNSIAGNLTVYGTFSNPSDRRLKEDVEPINTADIVSGVYGVDLVTFKFKDREGRRLGVISNDVIDRQPAEFTKYAIYPGEDGFLLADYLTISVMGIAAIQDLHKRVKALEKRVA